MLGIVTEGKSSSVKIVKTDTVDQELQSYIPPKASKKKNIVKENLKKRKKTSSGETRNFNSNLDESKDKNSNGALILDTLAEDDISETKEEKYIPPKTRQHLSPSVRKIVEENKY